MTGDFISDEIVTKSVFASLAGVSKPRVLSGSRMAKLVVTPSSGRATEPGYASPWLKSSSGLRLNVLQRISHSTARSSDQTTVDERIKSERLAQLQHANIRAAEDAAITCRRLRPSRRCEATIRRVAARLMAAFKSGSYRWPTPSSPRRRRPRVTCCGNASCMARGARSGGQGEGRGGLVMPPMVETGDAASQP